MHKQTNRQTGDKIPEKKTVNRVKTCQSGEPREESKTRRLKEDKIHRRNSAIRKLVVKQVLREGCAQTTK